MPTCKRGHPQNKATIKIRFDSKGRLRKECAWCAADNSRRLRQARKLGYANIGEMRRLACTGA